MSGRKTHKRAASPARLLRDSSTTLQLQRLTSEEAQYATQPRSALDFLRFGGVPPVVYALRWLIGSRWRDRRRRRTPRNRRERPTRRRTRGTRSSSILPTPHRGDAPLEFDPSVVRGRIHLELSMV
eukprot:scaffold8414_cov29-Phaeocystis_antarctica.AAC.1